MALNTQLSNNTVNAGADAEAVLFNSGFIDIYDGVQPATADTALIAQVKLARLTFSASAFPSAVNGVLTANAITAGTGLANGTAAWFRVLKSDGVTTILDGTVGTTASFNLQLPTTTISSGLSISCLSYVHSVAKSASGL